MHMNIANKTGALAVLLFDALEAAFGDLSPSAAAFLLTAFYRPGSTTTEIAAVAGVSQPTGVRVLAGLRARGFIQPPARAGRKSPVLLTNAGRSRASAVQAARLAAMSKLLGVLTPAELAQFEATADKLLAEATVSRAFARTTCRLCDHPNCLEPECPLGTRASALERCAARKEG
jgi:DNA-binding MarR family transcriptional regulator